MVVGEGENDGEDGKPEGDSEIVSWRPASRSTSFYSTPGGIQRSHFSALLYAAYIRIYYPR